VNTLLGDIEIETTLVHLIDAVALDSLYEAVITLSPPLRQVAFPDALIPRIEGDCDVQATCEVLCVEVPLLGITVAMSWLELPTIRADGAAMVMV
jgi:hypothetical protein